MTIGEYLSYILPSISSIQTILKYNIYDINCSLKYQWKKSVCHIQNLVHASKTSCQGCFYFLIIHFFTIGRISFFVDFIGISEPCLPMFNIMTYMQDFDKTTKSNTYVSTKREFSSIHKNWYNNFTGNVYEYIVLYKQ